MMMWRCMDLKALAYLLARCGERLVDKGPQVSRADADKRFPNSSGGFAFRKAPDEKEDSRV